MTATRPTAMLSPTVLAVLAAHMPTKTRGPATDPLYCPPCSESAMEWVTWTPEHVAQALADAGVLGPEQAADLRAEVERLRARIHEAVDECQRRYAPYVSRCDRHDGIARWFRQSLADMGTSERDWTWNSQAMRTLAVAVVEERDALWAKVERAEALRAKVELVEALHHQSPESDIHGEPICVVCGMRDSFPCATLRLIRGES